MRSRGTFCCTPRYYRMNSNFRFCLVRVPPTPMVVHFGETVYANANDDRKFYVTVDLLT